MKTSVPHTAQRPRTPRTSSPPSFAMPDSGPLAQLAAIMNQGPRVQTQLKLAEEIQSSEHVQKQALLAAEINQPPVVQPQVRKREEPAQREETPTPNRTGLPDQLKAGVESLSGLSLDDVKVHYNSAKPAQLNALAYAQGTDIHVASGQEKHLPHEAWHIVQQKQGRVRPTMQMKQRISVNDDEGLEKEADVMGGRALSLHSGPSSAAGCHSSSSRVAVPLDTQLAAVANQNPQTQFRPAKETQNSERVQARESSPQKILRGGPVRGRGASDRHEAGGDAAAIQLKPTGRVTNKYIEKILAEIPDEDLRSQLEHAWNLIGPKGEAYFDDEAEKFRGGYDQEKGTLILYIPEDKWHHFGDLSIEQKGIAIHELTHVAEVVANTKGLAAIPGDLSKIMETDLADLAGTVRELFNLLDGDAKIFKAVDFRSSTMYDYVDERLKYAFQYLTADRNFEFPTVLNQVIYVIEQKSPKDGTLRKTELYAALLGLQQQATKSRASRAS
jgi:hypothetical protein